MTQLEIMPHPPAKRLESQPWPTYPMIFRISSANEEGGERVYAVNTTEFVGADGHVSGLRLVEVAGPETRFAPVPGSARQIPAQLVLLAMGFLGPETAGVVDQLGVAVDERGNIVRDDSFGTSVPGVFACGDAGRGQSLIVWAIAEGRSCANGVDAFLTGEPSVLPRPVNPADRQLLA